MGFNDVSTRTSGRRVFAAFVVIAAVVMAACIAALHPWNTEDASDAASEEIPAEVAREQTSGEASDIPTVPSDWVSGPNEFETPEDAERYDQDWHVDGELQTRYGIKKVTTDEGVEYAAGELIVVLPASATESDVARLAEELGGVTAKTRVSEPFDEKRVTLVFADNVDIEALVGKALTMPGVRSATPNHVGEALGMTTPFGTPVVPRPTQLHLQQSRFVDAWTKQRCEGDVVVAVLDSGVSFDHEDLASNIDVERAWNAIDDRPLSKTTPDRNGHGTAVSGIISAVAHNGKGIAGASYNATILPIRVINDNGTYLTENLIAALDYLLHGCGEPPDVINMSLGGPSANIDLQGRINEASVTYGITCVASVGNDSAAGHESDPLRYPAACDGVIGVGAVTSSNTRCAFSNANSSVDLCALGQDVLTTTDPLSPFGRGTLYSRPSGGAGQAASGTSFAAPQVAAAAALLKAQDPMRGPSQIEELLASTARDLGSAGRDNLYGHGLLDAAAALGATATSGAAGVPYDRLQGEGVTPDPSLIKTYAVRDGSAAADFLGITNTNFDFS